MHEKSESPFFTLHKGLGVGFTEDFGLWMNASSWIIIFDIANRFFLIHPPAVCCDGFFQNRVS
jgi:hypothetical protein